MSIKRLMLFGAIIVAALGLMIAFSLSDNQDTKPKISEIEVLNNELESIRSDRKSGLFKLEEKKTILNDLEAEKSQLEGALQ